jgi:hypothetical protein
MNAGSGNGKDRTLPGEIKRSMLKSPPDQMQTALQVPWFLSCRFDRSQPEANHVVRKIFIISNLLTFP